MYSPWLSCSGTGSGPRLSTTHGTLPLSNWWAPNQSIQARTSSACPHASSAAEVIDPSRAHDLSYDRDPGWMAGPSLLIRMYASWLLNVSAIHRSFLGTVSPTRETAPSHATPHASRRTCT